MRRSWGPELTLAGGGVLPLLVESREGYRNLCALITQMKAGRPKGEGEIALEALEGNVGGLYALVGSETLPGRSKELNACEECGGGGLGPSQGAADPARSPLRRERVVIDVQRHRRREQEGRERGAAGRGRRVRAHGRRPRTASGHAKASGRLLLDALTCIREKADARRPRGACPQPERGAAHEVAEADGSASSATGRT